MKVLCLLLLAALAVLELVAADYGYRYHHKPYHRPKYHHPRRLGCYVKGRYGVKKHVGYGYKCSDCYNYCKPYGYDYHGTCQYDSYYCGEARCGTLCYYAPKRYYYGTYDHGHHYKHRPYKYKPYKRRRRPYKKGYRKGYRQGYRKAKREHRRAHRKYDHGYQYRYSKYSYGKY